MHDFILCPHCGEDVLESGPTCPHCNKSLSNVILDMTCPDCGWDNPSDNKVCWFCRTDLEHAKKLNWLWKNDKELQKLNKTNFRLSIASLIAVIIFAISFVLTCVSYAQAWCILCPCYYTAVFSCITAVVLLHNKHCVNKSLDIKIKDKLNALT